MHRHLDSKIRPTVIDKNKANKLRRLIIILLVHGSLYGRMLRTPPSPTSFPSPMSFTYFLPIIYTATYSVPLLYVYDYVKR